VRGGRDFCPTRLAASMPPAPLVGTDAEQRPPPRLHRRRSRAGFGVVPRSEQRRLFRPGDCSDVGARELAGNWRSRAPGRNNPAARLTLLRTPFGWTIEHLSRPSTKASSRSTYCRWGSLAAGAESEPPIE